MAYPHVCITFHESKVCPVVHALACQQGSEADAEDKLRSARAANDKVGDEDQAEEVSSSGAIVLHASSSSGGAVSAQMNNGFFRPKNKFFNNNNKKFTIEDTVVPVRGEPRCTSDILSPTWFYIGCCLKKLSQMFMFFSSP